MKEVLDQTNREYLRSLIPENMPDWRKSWEEGYKIGRELEIKETPFMKKYGVKSDAEYRLKMAAEGKLTWQINMGLATVDDEVAGLREAEKFNEETGLNISFAHQLPKTIVGTPKDKREGIPVALGYDLNEPEDWERITMASTVQVVFADDHLGYPNAVETTINSLRAGSMYQGMFGMFHQVAPGCPDEVWNMNENVKALGIVAAKYDDRVIVNSNQDDSLPAYCMDLASYLAWAKWERYVVTDLCKARYAFSFGNLTSNLIHKAAMWLAASDTFKKDDQPGIEFIYPNTVDHWDHHLHSNYGFQIPEALMAVLLERKFKTGASFLSVPISEKVAIPTVEEMLDMTGACQRTVEQAPYYEQLIDWTVIEELRDKIKEFSDVMFDNFMTGMKEAGIDTTNPIEMMVVLKKMDPTKFEKLFHPSIVNEGKERVAPLLPAALWSAAEKMAVDIIDRYKGTETAERLKNRRICVVSGDLHYFGLYVITRALESLGADVIDGGTSMEAVDVLDIADEYGVEDICVSLHNGQALPYARALKELSEARGEKRNFYLGGVLTSFINEGDDVPSDVTENIREMGLNTTESVNELIERLAAR
ncbi:MAG TPA: hypothetical protein IAC50_08510 [Candidatus Copromorpha excrementigallinarum]|uniref:B12-binding domain-containing protein n=1 Tax=Candidatus Allocopromorpha excrementigallinarum TaxID=2840742 RepID=A0A9D1I1G9_9FIRM|nr:hypothetical protein [Candidatus Copromorpha excrementigallinarum]